MDNKNYIVFSRKYRSRVFEEVIGQDHIVKTLNNAILKGNIGHAYLFAGPRGVGKTSMARIFAKCLNCDTGVTVNPCNKCNSCETISKSSSLDVVEIDGASNRKIDDVRHIIEQLMYPPISGPKKKKIYIIDEVHMLTNEAFNSFLKSLEEPPEYVVFIFATTEPYKIPATILSRCQRFDFKRIKIDSIIEKLKQIGDIEKIDCDSSIYHYIAMKADGSLRDAEVMLDQIFSFADKKITADMVQEYLGILNIDCVIDTLKCIFEKDFLGASKKLSEIYEQGINLKDFLTTFQKVMRDIILFSNYTADIKGLLYYPVENYEKGDISKLKKTDVLLTFLRITDTTQGKLRYSSGGTLDMEIMLADMIQNIELYNIDELITYAETAKIKNISNIMIDGNGKEEVKKDNVLIIDDKLFETFYEWYKKSFPKEFDDLFSHAKFDHFENNTVYIYFKDIAKLQFNDRKKSHYSELEKIMSRYFKQDSLKIEVIWTRSTHKDGNLKKDGFSEEVKQTLPEIKTIADAFGAKIDSKNRRES